MLCNVIEASVSTNFTGPFGSTLLIRAIALIQMFYFDIPDDSKLKSR